MNRPFLSACVLWTTMVTTTTASSRAPRISSSHARLRARRLSHRPRTSRVWPESRGCSTPTAATRAYGASVAFEAGARTAWHAHPRGRC